MIRVKKYISIMLICVALFLMTLTVVFNSFTVAKAQTATDENAVFINSGEDVAMPYGLFTSLTLSIDGGDGYVWATAKNSFTLFPATVRVILELYSSETYQESYTAMNLESRVEINDLNIGKSIIAKAAINGVQRYWKGRMYYKIDSKDWQEQVTRTWLYDVNGVEIL